ncbi:hypothetical protein P153DRAFT_361038 [Dothidotthia symphoricarpi CBS 119687]|uniref:Zn(2)-C6 fungal-type domain-containing protein n=1 Tax=Dothidotthia symphoricarpi CBS 119687 TaxID=1392245 RepID=A0A6A6A0Z6_9PLEO|nr:uncharacterized protein P153DRAFT_361038 [Dothidotthia symphoricarpi CBS 119687]KAF2124875.1 hypothetical protein P153DRAFT_361038 [Dothidotthia symphoricarpi CBS 119687]
MVGVAGRSKGCISCRKRKKGCDLQRPACGQCQDRGLTCEGYDVDRIFIYQKDRPERKALVITPPRTPRGTTPDDVVRFGSDQGTEFYSSECSPPNTPISLPEGFALSAYSQISMEAYVHVFIPQNIHNPHAILAEDNTFMNFLPMLCVHDPALRMAILAVGTAALGKTSNDAIVLQQGKVLYGKALVEMGRALRDPQRAKSEALLAIPKVMGLFEILFGPDANSGTQARSWLSHAKGELALIIRREPDAYAEDDAAHLLFANARYRPIVAAVRTRKTTVLNEECWRMTPWRNRVKTPNDGLLDVLAGVPELLEDLETLVSWTKDTTQEEDETLGLFSSGSVVEDVSSDPLRLQLTAKCWAVHLKLESWLAAHTSKIHTPVSHATSPIVFPSLECACLTIRYWAISILLYGTLDTVLDVPSDEATSHIDRPHPRSFARLVARCVSYFFQDCFGVTAATAISFPLGCAMLYMKRDPKVDGQYMGMITKSLNDPMLPSVIKDFLASMGKQSTGPTRTGERAKG